MSEKKEETRSMKYRVLIEDIEKPRLKTPVIILTAGPWPDPYCFVKIT